MGVKSFELNACVVCRELPIRFGVMFVAMVLPSGDLSFKGLLVGDAAAQTLGCQNGEFGFGHVEPASMFGRVMPFEPHSEAARFGGGESGVERGCGMGSVQKVGVSRRLHQWRRGGRDRLKQVAESRAERAVVDRTPDLQQQVGASSRPSHLLRLVHPPVDQKVGRAFSQRSSDAQACTVSFGIIDEPSALATEIVIDLVQRMPQLAGWHTRSAMTALTLEDMHDLADALECAPCIPGLAVPDPPVQSLDLLDDRRLAWIRPGSSVDNLLAACLACCSRMAMWNQSAIGGFVTPASASIDRRPGQPSVNAVNVVAAVRPTVSRPRRISTAISVPAFATAPKTWRLPSDVSMLPTRTSRCRSPSWQLRMKVESTVTVMLAAAAAGLTAGASRSRSPILSVWPRKVSGLFPASTGRRCASTPAATRYGIRAEKCARSWSSSGVDRQCDGQLTHVSL